MTACIKYPDISSLYYLALYKRTRRRRLYMQIDVGLISRNCEIVLLTVWPRVGHGSIFADPIQSNPKIAVIKANS